MKASDVEVGKVYAHVYAPEKEVDGYRSSPRNTSGRIATVLAKDIKFKDAQLVAAADAGFGGAAVEEHVDGGRGWQKIDNPKGTLIKATHNWSLPTFEPLDPDDQHPQVLMSRELDGAPRYMLISNRQLLGEFDSWMAAKIGEVAAHRIEMWRAREREQNRYHKIEQLNEELSDLTGGRMEAHILGGGIGIRSVASTDDFMTWLRETVMEARNFEGDRATS